MYVFLPTLLALVFRSPDDGLLMTVYYNLFILTLLGLKITVICSSQPVAAVYDDSFERLELDAEGWRSKH